MRKILKISLLLLILLVVKKEVVYAQDYNDSFYPGNYIDNEFIKKSDGVTAYYKEHRFINRTSDNQFAYCLEPFVDLKENQIYQAYTADYAKKLSLSKDTWDKIRLISYYGYGYGNHTAKKWYTITQIMIWRTVYQNGIFAWTSGLSSTVISKYEDEIAEINSLVEKHNSLPKYANKTYNVSINSEFKLEDSSFYISSFKMNSSPNLSVNKNNNSVVGISSQEGKYEINFSKDDNRFSNPPIIYTDNNAQNVLVIGNNEKQEFKTTINVESGSLKINKLDKDNESNVPSGNAKLEGTTYGLYDSNKELIKELVVDKEGKTSLNHLEYGSYCVKELKSGEGYRIDEEDHCFKISHTKLNVELNLYNEVIKGEVTINKYINDENDENVIKEPNISFNIKGITHGYENIITTNEEGKAVIILPYGKYLFKQLNTLPNYIKTDDFIVNIDGKIKDYNYELINKKESIKQKDDPIKESKEKVKKINQEQKSIKESKSYEISVPNTSSNKKYFKQIIIFTNIISYFFIRNKHYKKNQNLII